MKITRPARRADRRRTARQAKTRKRPEEGIPHALQIPGAESGGDAVHPQTVGAGRRQQSIRLSRPAEESPERALRAVITLRAVYASRDGGARDR